MIRIEMGCLSPPLSVQLEGITDDFELVDRFQLDLDAINRLYVRSVITSMETSRARQRLAKAIEKAVTP